MRSRIANDGSGANRPHSVIADRPSGIYHAPVDGWWFEDIAECVADRLAAFNNSANRRDQNAIFREERGNGSRTFCFHPLLLVSLGRLRIGSPAYSFCWLSTRQAKALLLRYCYRLRTYARKKY